ncbi:hypothetical protein AJ75_06565, partial [Pseudomonas aeruginosa BWH035]
MKVASIPLTIILFMLLVGVFAKVSNHFGGSLSLSEGDSTKYQKSTARSFLTLESPQKTENKA